ncbi:MAG: DUF305 domain-containing protein [Vulcanimicrobiota bacterium]
MSRKFAHFAICGLALVSFACSRRQSEAPDRSPQDARPSAISADERAYLHLMTEHQKLGVTLALQAQSQASAPEVKQLAQRLLAEENEDLNKLIGLGATAPDGREIPEQEARIPDHPRASGTPQPGNNLINRAGPGAVAPGKESYNQHWIKTFESHQRSGLKIISDFESRLTSRPLQLWTQHLKQREQTELAEIRSLRVL